MTPIEITAVAFSFLCVVLSIRRNVLNWPAGIIGVSAYMILFYREKLYADMVLQIFFVAQGIYGWMMWSKSKQQDHEIIVGFLSRQEKIAYGVATGVITFIWGLTLLKVTDASMPMIDAFAATSSFLANWLMARKKIENWILWMVADVVYIGLFWYKELYLSCAIYIVFLTMALAGLLEWRRKSLSTVSR